MKKLLIIMLFLLLCCTQTLAATQIGEDDSRAAFDNGTLVDYKTNLMWTKSDNGKDFSWIDATFLAQSFSLGSFIDWRLPTKKELKSLLREKTNTNGLKISELFHLQSIFLYASDTKRCKAAYADLANGSFNWITQSRPNFGRVLLVRKK